MKQVIHRQDEGLHYKSIPIHAPSKLHEKAFEILEKYVDRGKKVLDMGAGSGAFSQRIHDNGYVTLATELDLSDWKAQGIDVREIDLNTPFVTDGLIEESAFDAVTAIEVIEHLQNPTAFLKEAKKLLKPNGILLFTTPNVCNLASRLKFLRQGEFRFFTRDLVLGIGHISILPYWLLEEIITQEGLQIIDRRFIGVVNPNPKDAWKEVAVNFFNSLLFPSVPTEAAYPTCVCYACKSIDI